MEGEVVKWVFNGFCGLTLLSGVMVVLQSHPVRSVLCLVLTFFMSAVLWLMLQAEFLSLILLLVYVGAVMTLFLFVVMMLYVDVEAMKSHLLRLLPLGGLIVGCFTALIVYALSHTVMLKHGGAFSHDAISLVGKMGSSATLPSTQAALPNMTQIGMVLYTNYVYPFELAAVVLLIAMIAAITLTHRENTRSKKQDIRAQLMTRPEDRVKLVSIDSRHPERSEGSPPSATGSLAALGMTKGTGEPS
ncbi:MAG: NADH-quinone oxidoreductase subunit J [Gammaproteobacteria bacterium]|nr:NADH-quinone oxidoreductase subunit J [Gammaproteobacteria bacterium]